VGELVSERYGDLSLGFRWDGGMGMGKCGIGPGLWGWGCILIESSRIESKWNDVRRSWGL